MEKSIVSKYTPFQLVDLPIIVLSTISLSRVINNIFSLSIGCLADDACDDTNTCLGVIATPCVNLLNLPLLLI